MSNLYCPYCGSVSKVGDVFCQTCGASIDNNVSPGTPTQPQPGQPYHQPAQQHYSSVAPSHQYGAATQTTYVQTGARQPILKNQAADLSLVFAIIGLFVLPGIGGLLAIIFGIIGATNPYNRNKAIIGLVLGLCETIGAVFFTMLLFFW